LSVKQGSKENDASWTDKVGLLFPRIEEVSEHLSKEQGEQLVADYLRIVEDVITVRGVLVKISKVNLIELLMPRDGLIIST
jgi:hypothetical protein